MNPESLVKGGIAEHLVQILLEESGYTVIRIGREGQLGNIPRILTKSLLQSDTAGKVTTAPSLAVFEKGGKQVMLTKVKYRSGKSRGANISHGLKQLINYWPEAMLVLVTPVSPFFKVVLGENQTENLEKVFTQVKKETIHRVGTLVQKFL